MSDSTVSPRPVPPNFELLYRSSPFLDLLQPIYGYQQNNDLQIGIRCEAKHCNARGFIHGGVLCTLADIALGYNCALADQYAAGGGVTTNLTVDFIGSAKIGDWITVKVDVQKSGGTLAFANCYFFVEKKPIARANALFYRPQKS